MKRNSTYGYYYESVLGFVCICFMHEEFVTAVVEAATLWFSSREWVVVCEQPVHTTSGSHRWKKTPRTEDLSICKSSKPLMTRASVSLQLGVSSRCALKVFLCDFIKQFLKTGHLPAIPTQHRFVATSVTTPLCEMVSLHLIWALAVPPTRHSVPGTFYLVLLLVGDNFLLCAITEAVSHRGAHT